MSGSGANGGLASVWRALARCPCFFGVGWTPRAVARLRCLQVFRWSCAWARSNASVTCRRGVACGPGAEGGRLRSVAVRIERRRRRLPFAAADPDETVENGDRVTRERASARKIWPDRRTGGGVAPEGAGAPSDDGGRAFVAGGAEDQPFGRVRER